MRVQKSAEDATGLQERLQERVGTHIWLMSLTSLMPVERVISAASVL